MRSSKTLFFSVGEPSGDLHGANLIRQIQSLRPDLRCVGFGGPRMEQAGCRLLADLTKFAVMWISKVIWELPKFWRLLRQADAYFRDCRPDAVVLIDYPGFNWWVARRAKAHGIPVIYYGMPQLWAWAGWRVRKMRRLTDLVLCKLPFEESWLRARGCAAQYVGHPYFDELHHRKLDQQFIDAVRIDPMPRLTLLPGSRDQEVHHNLPMLLQAARIVQLKMASVQRPILQRSSSDHPAAFVQVVVASFNEPQAELARQLVQTHGVDATVCVGRTPELIELANCCLACSGSVSLELMHHHKPAVILYVVNRLGYFLQDIFRTVKYITLVNLLAADSIERRPFARRDLDGSHVPFPEYLTYKDASIAIADDVITLLTDRSRSVSVVQRLMALSARYGQPGATRRAAELIVAKLDATPTQKSGFRGPVGLDWSKVRRTNRENVAARNQEFRARYE